MDAEARASAAYLVDKLQSVPAPNRLLVGIAGIPASGKSEFAVLVNRYTNALLEGRDEKATLVGLDGWHLTRAQLDAMSDPKLAHDKRGAHWTFDGESYVAFVRALRQETTGVITAPSFDHAVKDPTPHAVAIHPHHRIVIIEGLYTYLSVEPWCEAGRLLDERWLIEISLEEAEKRLVKRHVLSGVAKDHNEAVWRSNTNDMPNGRFLLENILKPTKVIPSVHDPALAK
ncbi:P-loop containing nucleoside triphosphate hydrolase protein [Schizophyllum commune Tattone D]|nr:P-loop containing nucleoside triphosphate hydrolase protein [Schizophyllum commune Tattone D]